MKRSRSQGGYILGTVLAAMVIGLTIITALLGLSFATHRAAITQQNLAEERRAADGALETSVELMRQADPSDPCSVVPGTVDMDTPNGVNQVGVECTSILDARPEVQGAVTVIGQDSYKGAQSWNSAANGVPADASGIHLIHQGSEPVSFVGDVNVRTGAAVSGSTDIGSEVSGQYRQGDLGTGGNAGNPCGILSASGGGDLKRVIRDAEGDLDCDFEPVQSITRTRPSVPSVDTSNPIDPPSACSAGPVTTLQPGYYGNTQTKNLNTLMASPGCNNKTLHFLPGYYVFDAHPDDDFELRFPPATAGTKNYVFGELDSSTNNSCDPKSDKPTSVIIGAYSTLKHTGGNLTICAGEGQDPGTFPALARSGTSAVVGPTLEPATSRWTVANQANNQGVFLHPGNATKDFESDPQQRAQAELCNWAYCPHVGLLTRVNSTGARLLDSLKVRWDSWEKPPTFFANRQVSARVLEATGSGVRCQTLTPVPIRGRVNGLGLELDLKPGCIDKGSITTEDQLNGLRLELTFSTDSLPPPIGGLPNPPGCFPGGECPYSIEVWNLDLVVNEVEIKATDATSPAGHWGNPLGLREPADGQSASAEDGCKYPITIFGVVIPGDDVCDRPVGDENKPTPKEFTISGFGGNGWPPEWTDDTNISSARLALDNAALARNNVVANATFDNNALDLGWTKLSAVIGSDPCDPAFSRQGYTRSSTTYSIDLKQCDSQITTASVLAQTELTLAITPERNMFLGASGLTIGPGVELPQIDYARVVAETGDWERVYPMLFTIDESKGNRVRVYGDAELQLADVDIHWTGKASPFESIFNGNLKVNALSSLGDPAKEVGVVCCGFKYPNVLLTAQILDNPPDPDGPIRGVAQVFLDPSPFGPPHISRIADWELCHLDGCEVDAVAAGT